MKNFIELPESRNSLLINVSHITSIMAIGERTKIKLLNIDEEITVNYTYAQVKEKIQAAV